MQQTTMIRHQVCE